VSNCLTQLFLLNYRAVSLDCRKELLQLASKYSGHFFIYPILSPTKIHALNRLIHCNVCVCLVFGQSDYWFYETQLKTTLYPIKHFVFVVPLFSRKFTQAKVGTFLFFLFLFPFLFRSIVDDSEMYEQQKPFRLDELVRISAFLNNLVFKMLWNEMVDGKNVITRRFPDGIRPTKKSANTPTVFRKY